jgi:hypothetical protein
LKAVHASAARSLRQVCSSWASSKIDGATAAMTVRLVDRRDNELYRQTLEPQGAV